MNVLHDGGVPGFGSQLFLLPDRKLGVFVSVNTTYSVSFFEGLREQFIDHYYPVAEKPPPLRPLRPARPDFQHRAERFVGSYRPNRYARHTLEKASSLFTHVQVVSNTNGGLTLFPPDTAQQPTDWVEIEPLVFNGWTRKP